jgi:hypothetical protein
VLHLPDVAELVHHEVVRGLCAPKQNRPPESVPLVATQAGPAKDPRDDKDANAVEPHTVRVEIEPVKAGLRSLEPLSPGPTRWRILASARVTVLD